MHPEFTNNETGTLTEGNPQLVTVLPAPGDHAQYSAKPFHLPDLQCSRGADRRRALYPFFGILMGPIFAAFAMSASSLSVMLNALRFRTAKV